MATPLNGPVEPRFAFSHNNPNRKLQKGKKNHLWLKTYLIPEQFTQKLAIWKAHLSIPTKTHPWALLKSRGKKAKFELSPQVVAYTV